MAVDKNDSTEEQSTQGENDSSASRNTIADGAESSTESVDGDQIKLQVWDTAGQERFKTITSSYYRGAHGIIICYDTTAPDTFANVRTWLGEIDRYAFHGVEKLLVGTKIDLAERRRVSTRDGQELADHLGFRFLETSSKQNEGGVDDAFLALTDEIYQKHARRPLNDAQAGGGTVTLHGETVNDPEPRCCALL